MTDQETKKLDPQTIMLAASVPVIAIALMIFVTLNILSEPSRFLTSAQACYDKWLPGRLAELHEEQTKAAELIQTSTKAKFALITLQSAAAAMPDGSDFWDFKREHGDLLYQQARHFRQVWSEAREYKNQFYTFSGVSGDYPADDVALIVTVDGIKRNDDDIEKEKKSLQEEAEVNGQLLYTLQESEKILLSKTEKLKDPSISNVDRWNILDQPEVRGCLPSDIITSIAQWRIFPS